MKRKTDANSRVRMLNLGFVFGIIIVIIRIIFLQLFSDSANFLNNLASHQYQSETKLTPYRGTIYDHKYTPLAISVKTTSVAINPKIFSPEPAELRKLSSLLNISEKTIKQTIKKDSYFAWLKRKVSWDHVEDIKKMKLRGMHFLPEHARYYTGGASAAQLIGFVGTDNTGLFGLEYSQNDLLEGRPTTVLNLRDARGEQILLDSKDIRPIRSGKNIILTINRVIQEIAEKELEEGVRMSGSVAGFVLVSDPHTGRILAMASKPGFNPNDSTSVKTENTRNLAVAWRFEPGSVIKPFVIAAALEKKITTPYEIYNCENGRYQVGPSNYIHDDHPMEFATTEEILIYSSNICTFKIAEKLGEKGLYNALKNFGFANNTRLTDVPGSLSGQIFSWKSWKPIRFANISFGQGLLVTGLEIVQAYSMIANGGYQISPYVIDRVESQRGKIIEDFGPTIRRRVISSKTAQAIATILRKVTEKGTAQNAKLNDYSSAGKTGTAEKIDPISRRYSLDKRIANFAGFVPATSPHLVIYVVLDEPSVKPYYGGVWAAPVFRKIAEKTLKYLNVMTDLPLTST